MLREISVKFYIEADKLDLHEGAKIEVQTEYKEQYCHVYGVCVTYRRVLDWIYWHFIHSTRNCRQLQRYRYSHNLQFTAANILRFSVFTPH
jgi:hypothetical protein